MRNALLENLEKLEKFSGKELKKNREKLYKKIYKMAYPDESDGEEKDEEEESLCEKNPNQPGCGKVEAPGDYKKVQGGIAKDDADPKNGEIPNSMNSWSSG